MPFITRDADGNIVGVSSGQQTDGQEFLDDSDPAVQAFVARGVALSGNPLADLATALLNNGTLTSADLPASISAMPAVATAVTALAAKAAVKTS
jgi:hypothetical protein